MIFLDTSGIYALADRDDANHRRAVEALESITKSGETLLTHSYVIVESAALIHRRLGRDQAMAFLREASRFEIVWVTAEMHQSAVEELARAKTTSISLVDATSFLVMRSQKVASYLGFDEHFAREGFIAYE